MLSYWLSLVLQSEACAKTKRMEKAATEIAEAAADAIKTRCLFIYIFTYAKVIGRTAVLEKSGMAVFFMNKDSKNRVAARL